MKGFVEAWQLMRGNVYRYIRPVARFLGTPTGRLLMSEALTAWNAVRANPTAFDTQEEVREYVAERLRVVGGRIDLQNDDLERAVRAVVAIAAFYVDGGED